MKRKRFVKKMTSWIRGGILLLSNISLVSVGFASWTIGNNDGVSVGIIVDADADVIDINRYIAYSKQAVFLSSAKMGLFLMVSLFLQETLLFRLRSILMKIRIKFPTILRMVLVLSHSKLPFQRQELVPLLLI